MPAPHSGIMSIETDFQHNLEYNNNLSWINENGTAIGISHTMPSGPWYWPWCPYWKSPQHLMFQTANGLFFAAFCFPSTMKGQFWMHTILIFAFMLYSIWSWHVICAPDAFTWNFSFMFMNLLQVMFIIYQMRPVQFDPELEEVYHALFEPFKVSRLIFKKMISMDFATVMSLHPGEPYAMQNITKTDRLGLLLSGKVNVMSGNQFLHPIQPCEFLDSPEFESSRATLDEKFKVSIVAATPCRYIYWQRITLEYLFVKETYLASVVTTLIARDITTKLYAMNKKIITDRGTHLDIRLPSVKSSLAANGDKKAASNMLKAKLANNCSKSPVSLHGDFRNQNNRTTLRDEFTRPDQEVELLPLAIAPETNRDPSLDDVSTNMDDSSKYHSCEAVEDDDLLVQD